MPPVKEILQLPCNQLFSCSRESLFPTVQTGEEERTGSPVHLAVLEAVEPETQSLHLLPFTSRICFLVRSDLSLCAKKSIIVTKMHCLDLGGKKSHHARHTNHHKEF